MNDILEAAKKIKEYCAGRGCQKCIFQYTRHSRYGDFLACSLGDAPPFWSIEDIAQKLHDS